MLSLIYIYGLVFIYFFAWADVYLQQQQKTGYSNIVRNRCPKTPKDSEPSHTKNNHSSHQCVWFFISYYMMYLSYVSDVCFTSFHNIKGVSDSGITVRVYQQNKNTQVYKVCWAVCSPWDLWFDLLRNVYNKKPHSIYHALLWSVLHYRIECLLSIDYIALLFVVLLGNSNFLLFISFSNHSAGCPYTFRCALLGCYEFLHYETIFVGMCARLTMLPMHFFKLVFLKIEPKIC